MKHLTKVIIIIGIIFIILGIVKYIQNMNYVRSYYKVSENFDVISFYNCSKFNFQDMDSIKNIKKYHVLFLFSSDDCDPCIKEVIAYSELLKNKYSNYSIQSAAVVVDTNSMRLKMFIRRNTFHVPIIYGYDSSYVKQLQLYNGREQKRQIIIIDTHKKEIILRVFLKKG